ncbi:MAG: 50S ribosomal protein L18 [Planctomycetes bacterium]|nr:50S ribosomal protein L18 [Planctomycetota bacterium]
MDHQQRKWETRNRRKMRVRQGIEGTPERPRLSFYRGLKHTHAQIIDDIAGRTLCAASTVQKEIRALLKSGGNRQAAQILGEKIAETAKKAGITKVVFDRSWYRYHGRVKVFADAARKAGLQF